MRKIHPVWAVITAVLVLASLALCYLGSTGRVLYARTPGDPQETVTAFFDALRADNTRQAYELLDHVETLGLENQPQTEEGRLLMDALKASYRYTLVGDCEQTNVTATQVVRLTALDLNKVAEARVQELPADSEIVEVSEQPPEEPEPLPLLPVEQVLYERGAALYTTAEYTVTLRFTDGQWRIVLDEALLRALAGGR